MARDITSSAKTFDGTTCSAPPERSRRMCEIVLRHLPPSPALRILDLGCGTGSLVLELAGALTSASVTGIDVSAANIRAARSLREAFRQPERIAFEEADYFRYEAPPFDVIVTDGVLHLLPGSTEALVAKLAHDLRPGGVLVCAMAYDCAYNRMFAVVRRLLRAVRSPATDALILTAGRVLHGREMAEMGLRERLHYMYMPPARLETASLTAEIAPAAGLHVIARYPFPSVSPSQLRHRVTIFEKEKEKEAR